MKNKVVIQIFPMINEIDYLERTLLLLKQASIYVDKGNFVYRWIDTETADVIEQTLKPGDIVRQRPGQPHQLEALEDGVIFEISTQHFDTDSYRVWKGDSQIK